MSRPTGADPVCPNQQPPAPRVIRIREVSRRIGLSRTTLWRLTQNGSFPAPLRLSENSIGWLEAEVDHWISTRARAIHT